MIKHYFSLDNFVRDITHVNCDQVSRIVEVETGHRYLPDNLNISTEENSMFSSSFKPSGIVIPGRELRPEYFWSATNEFIKTKAIALRQDYIASD